MAPRIIRKRCGLDIGGTQIKAVILNELNEVIDELQEPSNANLGPEEVKRSILHLVQTISERGHVIDFIGIGCAGSVDSGRGIVRNSPNFAMWENVNLKLWLEEQLRIPVQIDNDANCATLAEWRLGKGRGVSNLVLLTLGTGIGGGLVLQGRLYRGSTGTAGELGHFSINSHGIPCPCGNLGCFERYCSASALRAKNPNLTCKEIFLSSLTDQNCKRLVDEFLHHLKVGLVSIANVFDPDMILLGGAISKGLEPYLELIRSAVKERAFPAVANKVIIDFTKFHNNSGALGAAILDLENFD